VTRQMVVRTRGWEKNLDWQRARSLGLLHPRARACPLLHAAGRFPSYLFTSRRVVRSLRSSSYLTSQRREPTPTGAAIPGVLEDRPVV
jgi:hypothetical protein